MKSFQNKGARVFNLVFNPQQGSHLQSLLDLTISIISLTGVIFDLGNTPLTIARGAELVTTQPPPWLQTSPDKTHFVFSGTTNRFLAWGFNYDRDDSGRLLEDYWANEWPKVAADFHEMKKLGANVIRIHLQLARFMKSPDQLNKENFARLANLVRLSEQTGLCLDMTGLGCYLKQDVPAWYDALDESARWDVQARFWRAVAAVCKESPAIFCYDLMNEPVASGDRKGDWLPGEPLAGKYYVQRLTTDMHSRTERQIAKAWIAKLTTAIRSVDNRHMITVGVIPWEQTFGTGANSAFRDPDVCAPLDFLSIHYYPRNGKLAEDLAILHLYNIGKPLVIEETFPLSASMDTTAAFIQQSRPYADGWLSFYWGTTAEEYEKKPADDKATLTARWLRRFPALRGEMLDDPKTGL